MEIELDRLRLRIQQLERDNRRQKRIVLDRDDALAEYAIREREVQRSPIKAIFWSCGESLPNDDECDAAVLEKRRNNLKEWTGIADFDRLVEDADFDRKDVVSGPEPLFNQREQLLIYLISIRKGVNFSHQKLLVGLGRTRTREMWKRVQKKLVEWSHRNVKFPTLEQWGLRQSNAFKERYPHTYMFLVDGTVLPCLTSSIPSVKRLHWNFKHSMSAKCFTILTTIDGEIVWASKSYVGKTHDREAWNLSGVANKLLDAYQGDMRRMKRQRNDDTKLAIGADKGYPGIVIPEQWILYLTKSAKHVPSRPTAEFEVQHPSGLRLFCPKRNQIIMDTRLATFRHKVEDVFSDLKDWQLLLDPVFVFTHTEELDDLIQVTSGLHNFNKYP